MRHILFGLLMAVSLSAFCGSDADSADQKQITIMTYNIKFLPRIATYIHHHPVRRARLIPARIEADESPDVIVFQEAFDDLAVHILKKRLSKIYPYNMGFGNRKILSYKRAGGVLIFSKYPLKEIESIAYSQCKGVDCMGHKGAMLVEVAHPAGRFQLLGTHMQAGGSRELKISQHREAGDLLRRHAVKGVPQFAAGDFNTHRSDPFLYDTLVKALDAEDGNISGEQQFTSDHLLNDMENYRPDKRNLIDFVFYRANGVKYASATRYIKMFRQRWSSRHQDLSDHFAVVLKIQLQPTQ